MFRQVAASWNGRAYLVAVPGTVVRALPPADPVGPATTIRPKGYATQLGLAAAGGSSLLAWTDDTVVSANPVVRRAELSTLRLDAEGKPIRIRDLAPFVSWPSLSGD